MRHASFHYFYIYICIYLTWYDSRISVDTRLHTLLDLRFNTPLFERGQFLEVVYNGSSLTALQNPRINSTNATPFDQGASPQTGTAPNGTVPPSPAHHLPCAHRRNQHVASHVTLCLLPSPLPIPHRHDNTPLNYPLCVVYSSSRKRTSHERRVRRSRVLPHQRLTHAGAASSDHHTFLAWPLLVWSKPSVARPCKLLLT